MCAGGGYSPYENSQYIERTELFDSYQTEYAKIVFLGDSITAKVDFNELFGISSSVNRGIGSDTTIGVLERLPQIEELTPERIFLMIGINDLSLEREQEDIVESYRAILDGINSALKETTIYCESILPVSEEHKIDNSDIFKLNQEIKAAAQERDYCQYIDLYMDFSDKNGCLKQEYSLDGVHLTAAGYEKLSEKLIPYIA